MQWIKVNLSMSEHNDPSYVTFTILIIMRAPNRQITKLVLDLKSRKNNIFIEKIDKTTE